MTEPIPYAHDGGLSAQVSQILIKQGEMGIQLAVITEKLNSIPDHETRIRTLEKFRYALLGAVIVTSAIFSAGATWVGLLITHK
jgi:hypothetical protein